MADNETNKRKAAVARWKAGRSRREFLAVYSMACALGAMLAGMAEALLKYVLKDERARLKSPWSSSLRSSGNPRPAPQLLHEVHRGPR